MKIYKKTYENVFDSEWSLKRCRFEKVSTDIGWSAHKYRDEFRKTIIELENIVFNEFIKFSWLRRRFCYFGYNRRNIRLNGNTSDVAYGLFVRSHVGLNTRLLSCSLLSCITKYLDDFFPNFDDQNPFEEKMEYPYKYMRIGHLFLVHEMTERLELLDYGEKHKMNYSNFADFVINQVYCYNDEKGKECYRLITHFIGKSLYVHNLGKKPYEE